ncbi:MAG: nickel-dependent lactate racemase, partial [Acidobacteriota bacterium]|nr:nickel-dependent lactate racemase [Acidobacteriota bacterium]
SDGTRETGAARFVPLLLDQIRAACDATVTFIVASGIHRRPTPQEVETILGGSVAKGHEVLIHDPDDESRLEDVGHTRAGTRVRVSSHLRDHDAVVVTGAASFHYYAGFGGGRKALVPGLAARETITKNHLRALRRDGGRHPGARAGRLAGNPVHRDMAEGAQLVGPHLGINSVMNAAGGIEALFVGHWRRSHEAATRDLARRRILRVERRDLIVAAAGGGPKEINLIQAHKAAEACIGALRPGGTLILVASCPEGTGSPDFDDAIGLGSERAMVGALRREFRVYAQTALAWHRKTRSHRVILVSHLEERRVRELGAEPAADLEAALRLARSDLPARTPGWILAAGAAVLVEPS